MDDPIDAVTVAVAYLKTCAEVLELVETRLSSRLPKTFPDGERLRVYLVGLQVSEQHGHLQEASLDVTGYAAGPNLEPSAFVVAARALAALLAMPDRRPLADGIVCTGARVSLRMVTATDDPTGTSGYRFGVVLSLHRAPS